MSIKKTIFAALMMAMWTLPALADNYPEQPVSFVVPFPPGDLEDVLTRMIAEDFQNTYGVAAAVVNKPGGGGGPFPGAIEVAKAPPDGRMIGSFVVGVPVVGPQIGIPELNPDPFEPLGIFLTYPFIIASSKSAPFQNMAELATYAKKEKVLLGHFGAALIPTQATLALASSMGFHYASDAAFDALDCNTLGSGDVDVINTTIQLVLPCLNQITVLATVTGKRMPLVADAPTVGELNPDLNIALWNGLFVHKDTPQHIRDKIIAVATKTVNSAKAKKIAAQTGAFIYWQNAKDAAAQIKSDIATIAKMKQLINKK